MARPPKDGWLDLPRKRESRLAVNGQIVGYLRQVDRSGSFLATDRFGQVVCESTTDVASVRRFMEERWGYRSPERAPNVRPGPYDALTREEIEAIPLDLAPDSSGLDTAYYFRRSDGRRFLIAIVCDHRTNPPTYSIRENVDDPHRLTALDPKSRDDALRALIVAFERSMHKPRKRIDLAEDDED